MCGTLLSGTAPPHGLCASRIALMQAGRAVGCRASKSSVLLVVHAQKLDAVDCRSVRPNVGRPSQIRLRANGPAASHLASILLTMLRTGCPPLVTAAANGKKGWKVEGGYQVLLITGRVGEALGHDQDPVFCFQKCRVPVVLRFPTHTICLPDCPRRTNKLLRAQSIALPRGACHGSTDPPTYRIPRHAWKAIN